MESMQIPFNYFYRMFQDDYRQAVLEIERNKIGQTADKLSEIFDFLNTRTISRKQQLSIYNQVLFDICANYVALSNSSIDVFPSNTLEFVDLILDTIHENPYKESFLMSLQFIYQDYLASFGKGYPALMSSTYSSSTSAFKVTLDSSYQITEFDAINMELVEQDKIMTKIVSMESNHQLGPIPKVLVRIRKDI